MKRQCGYRKKGGAYLTVPTSEDGMPIEYFLLDPPRPVDLNALAIAPRGVHLIEKGGVWHVFDVIGQENYRTSPTNRHSSAVFFSNRVIAISAC